MSTNQELKFKTLMATRDNGITSMLFRNAMARKLDLSLTESLCLTLLGIGKVSTPSEISKYTGLTTGATTTMLDRLEKKCFITRKSNLNDRRGVIIEINGQYSKAASSMVIGVQKAHKELIDSYSDRELEVITDFLEKFTKNVVEATKDVEE
ncbi:MAG: MarR family winged helix-turn-helix transcriptional regulator [Candidatus Dojkabacteria bacterium]